MEKAVQLQSAPEKQPKSFNLIMEVTLTSSHSSLILIAQFTKTEECPCRLNKGWAL